jgi:uncharacterized metal-binding protein YceD (DUF177 family)
MNDFSRLVALKKIGSDGLVVQIQASDPECAALATRMDIPGVVSLECRFELTPDGNGGAIRARASLSAVVVRECVVTAEDFETPVQEDFSARFVPSGQETDDPDPDLPDEIPYNGDTIDLGEAAAEQLALALDPYPRIDGAAVPDLEDDDDSASPFEALSRLASQTRIKH